MTKQFVNPRLIPTLCCVLPWCGLPRLVIAIGATTEERRKYDGAGGGGSHYSKSPVRSTPSRRLRGLQQECDGYNTNTCGCASVNQADYRGTISTTISGLTCQSWSDLLPHYHWNTPGRYPDAGLESNNYCRNPDDGEDRAWCYTNDIKTRWEYCDVPICAAAADQTMELQQNQGQEPPSKQSTEMQHHKPTEPPSKQPTTLEPISQGSPSFDGNGKPTNSQLATTEEWNSFPVCSTPELADLAKFTFNMRKSYQNANLTTISDGNTLSPGGASPSHTSCQTDMSKKKILFIGIDGVRADVVGMTPLPNFRRLQSMGTYSYWANVQTSGMAVSGPGWASMFTGVEAARHGVTWNTDLKNVAHPTVFKLVKDAFDKKIAASATWHPLITDMIDHEDNTTLDARYLANNDTDMSEKAKEWILSGEYDFIFVDFDGPDETGHDTGFDGYDPLYQNRVRDTDVMIGKLLDAMVSTSSGEEWLVVVTTDHGGEGTIHGARDLFNDKIPLLVASNSPRVNVGEALFDDPGSHMDVLPTIMHFLGGPGAVPDGLDGQVFGFNDHARVTSEIELKQ